MSRYLSSWGWVVSSIGIGIMLLITGAVRGQEGYKAGYAAGYSTGQTTGLVTAPLGCNVMGGFQNWVKDERRYHLMCADRNEPGVLYVVVVSEEDFDWYTSSGNMGMRWPR